MNINIRIIDIIAEILNEEGFKVDRHRICNPGFTAALYIECSSVLATITVLRNEIIIVHTHDGGYGPVQLKKVLSLEQPDCFEQLISTLKSL